VWDVADVETGAVRQLDEDEIFAADELQAQVGQTWIDEDCLVTLTRCRRFGGGTSWIWDVVESDGHERKILEEALFKYYARVDGLDDSAPRRRPSRSSATANPGISSSKRKDATHMIHVLALLARAGHGKTTTANHLQR
jgi:hypothetical protein